MRTELSGKEKEQLRSAIIAFLAQHHPYDFDASALQTHLLALRVITTPCSEDHISSALAFLEGLGFARRNESALGSTVRYVATSEGMRFHERSCAQ